MSYTGHKGSKVKRARKHGFIKRNSTHDGRLVMKRRRLKGRKRIVIPTRKK